MGYVIVCDVCETHFSRVEWDGMEAQIPSSMLNDELDSGDYAICSWECVANLANYFLNGPEEEVIADDEAVERILAPDQVQLPPKVKHAPEQPKLVQVPVAGIRVDGRPLQN